MVKMAKSVGRWVTTGFSSDDLSRGEERQVAKSCSGNYFFTLSKRPHY